MSLRHRHGNKAIQLHRESMFENQRRMQPGTPAEVRPPWALRNARARTPHSRAQSRQTPQRSQGTGGDPHRQASQHHQGEHKVTNKARSADTFPDVESEFTFPCACSFPRKRSKGKSILAAEETAARQGQSVAAGARPTPGSATHPRHTSRKVTSYAVLSQQATPFQASLTACELSGCSCASWRRALATLVKHVYGAVL